jgi:hypothetical protein
MGKHYPTTIAIF